jgi:hypothetical protein
MSQKSFKSDINPAMQFISQPIEDGTPDQITHKTPEGYKLNPVYVETKSRRLQLLLQPSLYERIKTGASNHNNSINDFIHTLLEKALSSEKD